MNSRRKILWMAAAVFVGAFAVRLINCQRGILSDELITYWVSNLPSNRIVEERLAHNHLPTYFLLMRQWLSLAGTSELTLRLPSMICGALAVAGIFLVCAPRFPLGLSLLAAALLGLNATHLYVSQWARMYASTTLLEVVFVGSLLSDLRRRSGKCYAAYVAAVIAGCSLHLLFLQMAAITFGFLVWEWVESRKLRVKNTFLAQSYSLPFPRVAGGRRQGEPAAAAEQPLSLAGALLRYMAPFLVGATLFLVWIGHAQALDRNAKAPATLSWLDPQTSPIPIGSASGPRARTEVSDPSRKMLRVAFGDYYFWPYLQSGWAKYAMRFLLYALTGGLLWAIFRSKLGMSPKINEEPLSRFDQNRSVRFALLWAMLPPLVMATGAVVFAWVPSPSPRWLAGTAAGWALLFACGCWKISGGVWARGGFAAVLVCLTLWIGWGWLRYPGDGLRDALICWHRQARPGEKVFLAHRGYLEQAMKFENLSPPPASRRSGTVLDYFTGAEGARRLADFAAGDSSLWVLHYRFPPRAAMEQAFKLMGPEWSVEKVFESPACSVHRITRIK